MEQETLELLRQGLILYIILAASIALHEWGHAYSADKLGDTLPRAQGRVTLNPLAHLDPIGTGLIPAVMIFGSLFMGGLPFVLIGWGRPVQISLRGVKNRMRAELLITAAGPFVNVLICLATALLGGVLIAFNPETASLLNQIIIINCALIVLNLIPIPPLDGSHFMRYALGMKEETYLKLASYGFIIMLVLINIPQFQEIFWKTSLKLASIFVTISKLVALA